MITQTKKYLLFMLVLFVIIGGAIVLNSIILNGSSQGRLEVQEKEFDFGEISMQNGVVSHLYHIQNVGSEDVKITKSYSSCMCTEAIIIDSEGERFGPFGMQGHGGITSTSITVPPGEDITLEAQFDPGAHGPSGAGVNERSIYLETNSSTSPKEEMMFRAIVLE